MNTTGGKSILETATALFDHLKQIRREIHQIPECGFAEAKTSQYIAERLSNWNIPFRDNIAKTGIIARIDIEPSLPAIALRAELDALPITEQTGVSYCSKHEGFMHACGHDIHMTCLLGALRLLNERKSELPVNVIGIFQPAEETVPGGALNMIKEGVLKNPKVDAIFGQHVDPLAQTGTISLKAGPMMASTAKFTITVHGKGGHAASPFTAVDPIPVAAQIVTAVQNIASRMIDPFAPAVISITQVSAGTAYNIIPESASLVGTTRTLNSKTADMIPHKMEQIVKGITESFETRYTFEYTPGTPVLENDETKTDVVRRTGKHVLGDNAVQDYSGTFGGEDFAEYLQIVPGCFFRLGCMKAGTEQYPLHHPKFNPDEQSIIYGTAMFAGIALHYGQYFEERTL